MSNSHRAFQPTLRQLLNSEGMLEAQVMYGEELLDRQVVQVVSSFTPPPRAGSLVVARTEVLLAKEPPTLKDLAAVVLIKPATGEVGAVPTPVPSGSPAHPAAPAVAAQLGVDASLKKLLKLCREAETPLIVVPSFGEPGQVADDVRMSFLKELRHGSTRLHASLLTLVLEEGLEGLVEEVSNNLNRPVAVETADFKVLAARNVGATPASQQKALTEEARNLLRRQLNAEKRAAGEVYLHPVKVGRRLCLPIVQSEMIVGYISAMVRPTDDTDDMGEYLQAAALAAMVDFAQRSKDGTAFAVTQKSLLKDLLSGHTLSAADQERLERHYGFDLCDGLLVFAVETMLPPSGGAPQAKPQWTDDKFIYTEVEGTRIFVVTYMNKSGHTWQQEAETFVKALKSGYAEMKVQLGAGRLVETILDLPDAYREARMALIVGSMMHGDREFSVGYGELGVRRLLYLMIDHPELERFYQDNLEPLEKYDAEWESELVPSLRVYLQQGANLNSAARALFIHRHTLRYRLEQIADILVVDIDSQEVLLNLQIAFLIKDMLGDANAKGKARG